MGRLLWSGKRSKILNYFMLSGVTLLACGSTFGIGLNIVSGTMADDTSAYQLLAITIPAGVWMMYMIHPLFRELKSCYFEMSIFENGITLASGPTPPVDIRFTYIIGLTVADYSTRNPKNLVVKTSVSNDYHVHSGISGLKFILAALSEKLPSLIIPDEVFKAIEYRVQTDASAGD